MVEALRFNDGREAIVECFIDPKTHKHTQLNALTMAHTLSIILFPVLCYFLFYMFGFLIAILKEEVYFI